MLNIELSYSQQSSSSETSSFDQSKFLVHQMKSLLRGTINGFNGCRSSRN